MYTVEETIAGLIEFDSVSRSDDTGAVLRQTMLVRCASDESLQSTLASLALDQLQDVDSEGDDWNESQIMADVEALEQDLLLVYRRVVRKIQ